MRFHPGGISNCVAGTAPAPIEVVSIVISAACTKLGAGPLPAEPLEARAHWRNLAAIRRQQSRQFHKMNVESRTYSFRFRNLRIR